MRDKTLFLLALLLLLLNIIVINYNKESYTGEIKEIKYSRNKITLHLKNNNETFVIFTDNILDLKNEDHIKIFGGENVYRKEKQIIASKIIKYSRQKE